MVKSRARNAGRAAAKAKTAPSTRERLLLDFGWKFHLGHAANPAADFGFGTDQRTFAKAGVGVASAAAPDFDDSDWAAVDLPHDWAVELPFVAPVDFPVEEVQRATRAAHGFKPLGRDCPETSIGWYRKCFAIPASDLDRRLCIEFDGVFRSATVIFNGYVVATSGSGYGSFAVDVTDFVEYGRQNVLLVRVDASLGEGWFYEGAGIYRHVWLVKQDPLHVARWGTFVRSTFSGKAAKIAVATDLVNEGPARPCRVVSTVITPDGRIVAVAKSPVLTLGSGKTRTVKQAVIIKSPALWSPETPSLYRLFTRVEVKGKAVDDVQTPFGIRTFRFDAAKGFILNGRPVKLKGTNNHQDHAGVGVAIPDALHAWRVRKLKEVGCNAYRCAHNPPAAELLDACDRLGMLVIDETRRMSSDPESMADLEAMIRRDRNHPSVFLWSIGNEEPQQASVRGARIAATMKRRCRELDPTRSVNAAIENPQGWGDGIGPVLDVVGINYHTDMIAGFLKESPQAMVINTETSATTATRGVYVRDEACGYSVAYDSEAASWATTDEAWMTTVMPDARIAGGFVWSGFDYRGEPFPFSMWPNVSCQFGILDTCGFWKDSAHYYHAWWGRELVLHLFPHWNWREGETVNVWVHANLDAVELFLNGESLGVRKVEAWRHAEWDVVFAPGTLEARGYKAGKLAMTTKRETAGAPAQIRLTSDRTKLAADGEDVAVIAVEILDDKGRLVPGASDVVSFAVTGAALIGVGNGDPRSQEPDKALQRSAFNGLCSAIVRAPKKPGEIRIAANTPGLVGAVLTLAAVRARLRPAL